MSETLIVCHGCSRHIRASESACPFCKSARGDVSRAALLVGATLAGALAYGSTAHAQPTQPRFTIEQMPAQAYGAPPRPPYELPGPVVQPTPPPVQPTPPPVQPTPPPSPGPAVDTSRLRVSVAVLARSNPAAVSVRRALERSDGPIATCRAEDPTPLTRNETATVTFSVAPNGRVSSAAVSGRLGGPRFIRCLLVRARALGAPTITPPPALTRVALRVTISPTTNVVGTPDPAPGQGRCGPNPAGCRSTGCPNGMVCDTRARCVPSSCGCNPSTGAWTCTSDCGGGVCVPANVPRPPPRP